MSAAAAYCPNCGAAVASDDRFCRSCGQAIAKPAMAAQAQPPVPATPTPAAKKSNPLVGCLWILAILAIGWYVFGRGGGAPTGSPSTPAGGGNAATPHAAAILLQLSGSGIRKSTPFTVGGPWMLTYEFDCSSFGSSGNFIVTVYDASGGELRDIAVNELAARGSSSTPVYETGTLYLEMNSECRWSVRVDG